MPLFKVPAYVEEQPSNVESTHTGEISRSEIPKILENPRAFAESSGIRTTEESQVKVMVKNRTDRHPISAGGPAALAQRVPIIVIHWECCCTDIVILSW
jgi:hypothetical protein